MRVVVFAVWVGPSLPAFAPQFRERAAAALPLVEFRIVHLANQFLVADFCGRIEKATGVRPAKPLGPRKVCDFRPAFGQVFASEIGDAEWWGWCDLDCVFGDMPAFLTEFRLMNYDLVSDNHAIVNGPFTIMRNSPLMRTLYRRHGSWAKVFSSPEHVAFDEIHFTELVRGHSEAVRALFLKEAHAHDNQPGVPRLEGGKLYAPAGNEILTYHFVRGGKAGRWPL